MTIRLGIPFSFAANRKLYEIVGKVGGKQLKFKCSKMSTSSNIIHLWYWWSDQRHRISWLDPIINLWELSGPAWPVERNMLIQWSHVHCNTKCSHTVHIRHAAQYVDVMFGRKLQHNLQTWRLLTKLRDSVLKSCSHAILPMQDNNYAYMVFLFNVHHQI